MSYVCNLVCPYAHEAPLQRAVLLVEREGVQQSEDGQISVAVLNVASWRFPFRITIAYVVCWAGRRSYASYGWARTSYEYLVIAKRWMEGKIRLVASGLPRGSHWLSTLPQWNQLSLWILGMDWPYQQQIVTQKTAYITAKRNGVSGRLRYSWCVFLRTQGQCAVPELVVADAWWDLKANGWRTIVWNA